MRTTHRKTRAGLSIVEVVVSTMLVALVLIGAMDCVGAVIRGRMVTGDTVRAQQLADQLMAEILDKDYLEPIEPPVFGRETSESGSVRTDWDDVDDFHLWNGSPPRDQAGTPMPDSSDWQRGVVVEWVDPNDPAKIVGIDQGVKRITVTVQRNSEVLAQRMTLRSDSYRGAAP